ncbi:MAG: hypothetical protein ABH846_03520 [Patescibacteria group bacterium]
MPTKKSGKAGSGSAGKSKKKATVAKKSTTVKKAAVAKSKIKKIVAKKSVTKAPKTMMMMEEPPKVEKPAANVCHACNALPVGSVELVSLLLVLTFSLSAVLITSVYALGLQQNQIEALEAQVGK